MAARGAAPKSSATWNSARDEVRVMTVHGAKGLEANTVILADTTKKPEGITRRGCSLLDLSGGAGLVWAGKRDSEAEAVESARAKPQSSSEANEYRRLLYVAMTRAERRLVICGTSGAPNKDGSLPIPDECWYRLMADALVEGEASLSIEVDAEDGMGKIHRYRKSQPHHHAAEAEPGNVPEAAKAPAWLASAGRGRCATFEGDLAIRFRRNRCARAGGELEREQALERGRLMHRLIQSLPDIPPKRRQEAAQEFLNRNTKKLAVQDRDGIATQALALLADPLFASLFAPGSRAEVPLVGTLPRTGLPPYAVTGQVDRLLVTPSEVLIADYKTNRPAPANLEGVPRAYRRQLALYRALLQSIYPGRAVRAALVFTETPLLLEIPQTALDTELATLTGA